MSEIFVVEFVAEIKVRVTYDVLAKDERDARRLAIKHCLRNATVIYTPEVKLSEGEAIDIFIEGKELDTMFEVSVDRLEDVEKEEAYLESQYTSHNLYGNDDDEVDDI